MQAISSNFGATFDPTQMAQRANEKFKAADTDGNAMVSKQEFSKSMEANGINVTKAEKMFNRIDQNGDGQISSQEHQNMVSAMEQRMSGFMGGADDESNFDAVTTLLKSLEDENLDEKEQQSLTEMLEKIRSEGYSESAMADSLNLVNELIPRVDTSV